MARKLFDRLVILAAIVQIACGGTTADGDTPYLCWNNTLTSPSAQYQAYGSDPHTQPRQNDHTCSEREMRDAGWIPDPDHPGQWKLNRK
jgi:hypothetical protein